MGLYMKPLPSQTYLLERLTYDPVSGLLFWNPLPKDFIPHQGGNNGWNAKWAGKEAGHIIINRGLPYRCLKIDGMSYAAHRVIFKMIHGIDPMNLVDHRDGNTLNNALSNLREADSSENKYNGSLYVSNTSGIKGVSLSAYNRWLANITVRHRRYFLGSFSLKESADAIVNVVRHFSHGDFARRS